MPVKIRSINFFGFMSHFLVVISLCLASQTVTYDFSGCHLSLSFFHLKHLIINKFKEIESIYIAISLAYKKETCYFMKKVKNRERTRY